MSGTTQENPTDLELLRLAKTGDFAAFQQLIDGLQPKVYGLALRILRQAQDAEDVTQQTFVSLIEHLEEFRQESSVKTWVMKIASNHALKILRKKRTVGMIQMSSMAAGPGDTYGDVPHPQFIAPWTKPPDELAEQSETQREIERALGELDEKYRLVFILRDIEGMSVRETAEALELTEATVKVRLLRARLALRERLTKRFGDEDQAVQPDHKHS